MKVIILLIKWTLQDKRVCDISMDLYGMHDTLKTYLNALFHYQQSIYV